MPSNQILATEGASLQVRLASTPCDRRSISESLGSEATSSSVSIYRAPAIPPGTLRLDNSESRSSIERHADEISTSHNLHIENFIAQQVV